MDEYAVGGSSLAAPPVVSRPASAMRRNHSYNTHYERPESSASNQTRNTLSSSGVSVAGSSQNGQTPRAGSGKGASLLQERLRERKVESARAASMSSGGGSSVDVRGIQSSPIKGSNSREDKRPGSSGVGQSSKGMGVKQMEDQVSTLHKQNFDLKLELYHRRQRQEALETQLEEKERLLEEFAEMREVNDQLLAELERRDQALDEAVGVIVNLEDKVDRLMKEREMVRSVDENPYHPPSDLSVSAPTAEEAGRRQVVRMPSFLSEKSEGTEALRSLYLPSGEGSLPRLDEESVEMNSPRLSILSESSFLSVYGDKLDLNDGPEEQPKRRRSSVEKWVGDRAESSVTPTRVSPDLIRRKQFVSINDVLESPLQRLEKLRHTLEKHTLTEQNKGVSPPRKNRGVKNVMTDKKSFENHHSLPPTPDTFSTNTLNRFKGSDDTLAAKGSFLNNGVNLTTAVSHNYQSTISVRPRSAGETVTSRRDGHGWDTETQADTETGSTTSTYSPSNAYDPQPVKRVHTPDLFNFQTADQGRDWGRDMMFNTNQDDEVLELPPLSNKRVERARRASMAEAQQAKSDDTVMRFENFDSSNERQVDRRSAVFPLDEHSPRPDPPDRRSSLIATQKLRHATNNASSPIPPKHTAEPQPAAATPSRKARLASKIFRRGSNTTSNELPVLQQDSTSALLPSKNAPAPPAHGLVIPRQRPAMSSHYRRGSNQNFDPVPPALNRRNTDNLMFEEGDRATPPPIARSRTTNPSAGARPRGRPSSAGTGAVRVKRMSGFGGDAAYDEHANRDEGNAARGDDKVKERGHHRQGSLSIDLGVARGLSAILGGSTNGNANGGEETSGEVVEGKRKWLGLRRG